MVISKSNGRIGNIHNTELYNLYFFLILFGRLNQRGIVNRHEGNKKFTEL